VRNDAREGDTVARPTKEQIEKAQRSLLEQRDALYGTAREELTRLMEQPLDAIAGEVADAGDDSVALLVTDLGRAEVQRRIAAIRDIDLALERIASGQYGICVDCGGEIDSERLAAFPTALRDVDCQARHERTYAHQPTPTL
jgi:RNA polymerase-binding transcription factor DksA